MNSIELETNNVFFIDEIDQYYFSLNQDFIFIIIFFF